MSTEQNEAIIIQMFEALSTGDIGRAVTFWAPNNINHGRFTEADMRQQRPPAGLEGLRRVFDSLHTAFPDRQWRIEDLIAAGDRVVCRLTLSGTHQGRPTVPVEGGVLLSTIPPTGKPYTIEHIHIFRIADGKIAEHWAARDDLGLLEQLGASLGPRQEIRNGQAPVYPTKASAT